MCNWAFIPCLLYQFVDFDSHTGSLIRPYFCKTSISTLGFAMLQIHNCPLQLFHMGSLIKANVDVTLVYTINCFGFNLSGDTVKLLEMFALYCQKSLCPWKSPVYLLTSVVQILLSGVSKFLQSIVDLFHAICVGLSNQSVLRERVCYCSCVQASSYAATVDLIFLFCSAFWWIWSLLSSRRYMSWSCGSKQFWCFLVGLPRIVLLYCRQLVVDLLIIVPHTTHVRLQVCWWHYSCFLLGSQCLAWRSS